MCNIFRIRITNNELYEQTRRDFEVSLYVRCVSLFTERHLERLPKLKVQKVSFPIVQSED